MRRMLGVRQCLRFQRAKASTDVESVEDNPSHGVRPLSQSRIRRNRILECLEFVLEVRLQHLVQQSLPASKVV